MANQIQKKFILDGAIDGVKIKLLYGQALKGLNLSGQEVEMLKIDGDGNVLLKGAVVATKAQLDQVVLDYVAADAVVLSSAQSYADTKKAEAISEILGGAPAEALDTIKELADALQDEQDALASLITTVGTNLQTAKDYADSQDVIALQAAKDYADAQIAAIPPVDLSGKADISYVDSQDAQVLVDAKAYTDAQIAAIPPVDLSTIESNISTLQGKVTTIEGEIDTLQSDVLALQNAQVITFEKESFTAASPLTDISLAHQAIEKSLVVFVGRLALHAGEDYTVSVVGGVTKLTWAGDFAVGGVEGIEAGDKIKVIYAYMA